MSVESEYNGLKTLCAPCVNFNISLCSEELFVYCKMFPQRMLPLVYLMPATIVLVLIFISGVIGNLWVIRRISGKKQDFNTTDYYLLTLALSDMAFLLCGMPYELWYLWHLFPDVFGQSICQLNKLLTQGTGFASSLNILMFSLERYRATKYPFKPQTSGLSIVITMIIIWTVSIGSSLPFALLYKSRARLYYPPNGTHHEGQVTGAWSLESVDCRIEDFTTKGWLLYYFVAIAIVLFLLPLLIQIYVYVALVRNLKCRTLHESFQAKIMKRQNRKTYIIAAVLVTSFVICWFFYHFQRIFTVTFARQKDKIYRQWFRRLYVIASMFYYLSAAINPLMYRSYRKKVVSTILSVMWRRRRNQDATGSLRMMGRVSWKSSSTQESTVGTNIRIHPTQGG